MKPLLLSFTLALSLAACTQTTTPSALHGQATSATATFSTSSSWDGGFNGVITLSNPTSTPLTTWTLKFKFNGAASTTSVWGAGGSVTTASDGTVTITPNTWGGSTIPANGSVTVNYGGSGTYSGVNTCTLNGAPCSGGTTPTPGGDTTAPTVSLSATPSTLTSAGNVTLTATAADNVGVSKVEFYRGTTLLATDTSSPYSATDAFSSSAQNGSYSYTAKAYDAAGNTRTSAAAPVTVNLTPTTPPTSGALPKHALFGYWHNFDNGSGYIRMKDVNPAWDVIDLAFAENRPGGAEGEVAFTLCTTQGCGANAESEADFIAGIRAQQAKGKKVLISLGGANAHIQLNTTAARDNFVRTMGDIIARYGLNGLDIDLEGGSLALNPGDTDLNHPTTPAIVNLIAAVKSLKARFGANFLLTMAPETAYVQGGLSSYGGIWGAYLPLIHNLRAELTTLHVQHYNTGSLVGTDGRTYTPGTVDFHVAMTDMLLTGFNLGGDPNKRFPGLRADQVAIGLPSGTRSASSGYTAPADVQRAVTCLTSGANCNTYRPGSTYPALRGLMTWSINWDRADGLNFSGAHRAFLNNLP
ncbi:chitinase [Deinococcus maricopensis]|uniref:chitinase n=1 Tax=Deinococcus maricopensis (strain DSM 21211 / LMG 22137 / NRRL B-23946 / LB-34) TaxID=709986 RepID=E8U3R7_DEIML|nr:glycosyl hydrolase family 18 protein [Deinococcus maricopensis]ADV68760.1 Chitinase [Deinococcus maricopensis DSM 21211]